MKRPAFMVAVAWLFAACHDVQTDPLRGPQVAITNADYLVLRPVAPTPTAGSTPATVYEQTVYYDPTARIMDLRHFDPRTAQLEQFGTTYAVSIRPTPEGDEILGTWTSANVGRQLGLFVDGKLAAAPYVRSKITSMIIIESDFTKAGAEAVIARLRRGGGTA